MELSARLTAELSALALGVVEGGTGLVDDLTDLLATLADAVSGYAGLRLTLLHGGHPVRLTALHPPEGTSAVTSLRLPLPPLSTRFEEGGRLVLWSTVAGSLVDLAADLGYVLHHGDGDRRGQSVVELDVDLPLPTSSGVDGLEELATIHRAAGFLIGRGHDPASVHATLREGGSAAGLSTYAWALLLLEER